jgi:hypothetical protein
MAAEFKMAAKLISLPQSLKNNLILIFFHIRRHFDEIT